MPGHLFMTGATGQVGAFVAREFLARGHRLSLLVRGESGADRLAKVFRKVGASGDYRVVPGDINGPCPQLSRVDAFVHVAADISFSEARKDEVWKSNYQGTANVLEWAATIGAGSFHYVSTAYVAGKYGGAYSESDMDRGQNFHNDYEASKLAAEKLCHDFCREQAIPLTIYRPGIVMGTQSGETLRYHGYYFFLYALSWLQNKHPQEMDIRIEAGPEVKKNIVPVDYVARVIAALTMADGPAQETIFILPERAPNNAEILEWIKQAMGLAGLSLVAPGSIRAGEFTSLEQTIADNIEMFRPYLVEEPDFEHHRSLGRIKSLTIDPPRLDADYFRKMVEYARADNWGRARKIKAAASGEHPYFSSYLGGFVEKSFVPGVSAVTSRFAVKLGGDGMWELCLEKGILKSVRHAESAAETEFVYEVPRAVFDEIIAGKLDPRSAFFAGKTEIRGNIEQGLKVANVLREFFRLNPYPEGKK